MLACGLIALVALANHNYSQSAKPKLHRHARVGSSVDVPEFSMDETSPEADMKKENLVTSPNKKYEAFTFSDTRLFVSERRTGKVFEIRGLPLDWRPFSDLAWANNHTLMFDRWSQPHYGVHYAVNVTSKKLMVAAPFPD
jgi:hypothetical protein